MTSYGPLYSPRPVDWRSLQKIVEPEKQPVSVLEVKQQLRIESCMTEDDGYIERLIKVATEYCETYCDMTFITSKWKMRMDQFPNVMNLPKPPAYPNPEDGGLDVAIKYVAPSDCDPQIDLEPDQYRVDFATVPGSVYTKCDGGWPSVTWDYGSVEVEWWAGFGPDETDVPEKIRHAILMLVGQHYERRLAAECGTIETLYGVKSLLDASKWGAYS
jgi:uncharacterized phiE125 gp8 family phage protein